MTLKVKIAHKGDYIFIYKMLHNKDVLCLMASLRFSPSWLIFPILPLPVPSLTDWSTCTHSHSIAFRIRPHFNQIFKALPQVPHKPSSSSSSALFCSFLSALFLSPYFSCWTSAPSMLRPWTLCQSWDPGVPQSTNCKLVFHLSPALSPCLCTLFPWVPPPFILYPLLIA